MIGQNDGIKNELDICDYLNNRTVESLNENWRRICIEIFGELKFDKIFCKRIGGQGFKPDIELRAANRKVFISIKKGTGNSVHQEKTDQFLMYCCNVLNMNDKQKNALLYFLYGDGTLNGDSDVEDRMELDQVKITYQDEIKLVQNFFNKNKKDLIERFLVYGKLGMFNNLKADYIYYGDKESGTLLKLDEIAIEEIAQKTVSGGAALSIGALMFQVWNRNTSGKISLENRRHSIQVKWPSLKNMLEEIKPILDEKRKKDVNNKNERVRGDNSIGFLNQDQIYYQLNNITYKNLNNIMRNYIDTMFEIKDNNELILANKVKIQGTKPRIRVYTKDEEKFLSIFMGKGNAVHQEKIDTFIDFCMTLGATSEEVRAYKIIHYGDGTIDGSAQFKYRMNRHQIKKNFCKEIYTFQNFLNKHKKDFIERFLIYGRKGKILNIKSDFLFYGTIISGRCIDYKYIINFMMEDENHSNGILNVGRLSIQTWNRNLHNDPGIDHKRDSIQVKWGTLERTINEAYEYNLLNKKGTADGDWEEFNLINKLNRNKNPKNKLWSTIISHTSLESLDNIYAVKVSSTQFSKLSNRMVLPKTDIYLIRSEIPDNILIMNNYRLDEDVINNFDYDVVLGTGISCKRPNSKDFTYAKFSVSSFIELFRSKELGVGICLFTKKNKDLLLNENIIKIWNCSLEEIFEYYKDFLKQIGIYKMEQFNVFDKDICLMINYIARNNLIELINRNQYLQDAIFWGINIFSEPYCAHFIYSNNTLVYKYTPNYLVTTGSGRHKGKCTIIIKPRC